MTSPSPYDQAYWDKLKELRCRPVLRIEDLAGIPRDEVRRKYKADHPHIDAMQGEVHEGEQDV